MVLFLAISGPKFTKFWDDALSQLSISCSLSEILAVKVSTDLQSRGKYVAFGLQIFLRGQYQKISL